MITFIPKRPHELVCVLDKPNAMNQLAFDKAYKRYCEAMQGSFIDRNNCYDLAHNLAISDALLALSVYLSYACEGMLYGEV